MAESLLANELTISFRTDEQLAGAHQDAINRNQRRCLIRDFREAFMSEVRVGEVFGWLLRRHGDEDESQLSIKAQR